MTKDDLRAWIDARRLTRVRAAELLALSVPALDHQLNGYSQVGRQTERIAELLANQEGR
jgi:hypothetical protein